MLLDTSLLSMRTRYALLKQFYSWLVLKKGKGSFFRPLTFEFYLDEECYEASVIETQFLVGRALMVAPVLEEGQTEVQVYFPGETDSWFEFSIEGKAGRV